MPLFTAIIKNFAILGIDPQIRDVCFYCFISVLAD